MLRSVFAKSLRDQRRSLVLWALGAAFYAVLIAAVYPSIHRSSSQLQSYVNSLPDVLRKRFAGGSVDLSSGTGFFDAELFSFVSPLIFVMFSIGAGVRAIAGEKEAGTLELLLSYPLRRWRVVSEKFAALVVGLAVLLLAHFVTMLVFDGAMRVGIGVLTLLAANLSLGLLALALGTIAFAVGTATGRRNVGIVVVAAAVGLLAYLLNTLALLVVALKAVRRVSLFYYYGGGQPLRRGVTVSSASVLVAVTVIGFAVTLWLF
ncbi:MAG: ABC transporter permease subunit [Thermoleophilia bacterium]